jgi:hypothetical protein
MRARIALLSTILFAVFAGACADQPLEPTVGSGVRMIDSTAWRQQMAQREGLFLSGAMTECGVGACSFSPADYHCGGVKVECSTQTADIDVTWIVTDGRKTVYVSGRGALLCNSTMGTVIAYDANDDPVAVEDLVPISPADCGTDNITFGGQATVSFDGGIDHIVIQAMSPFTFPVGGGTGIASAFYTVTYNEDAVPFTLACTPTVERASVVTCTATATGAGGTATITDWRFIDAADGWPTVRSDPGISDTTWSGQLVVPGRVEITASVSGVPFGQPMISNAIAITPRNWSTVAVPKNFGQIVPSQLPIHPTALFRQFGLSDHALPRATPVPAALIGDGGPNAEYIYYTAPPFAPTDSARISEALAVGSDFYNQQQLSDKKVQGKLMCGRDRVPQMVPIIEAHEGLNWTAQPNSHAAIYFRVTDSLIRKEGEALVGRTPSLEVLGQSIHSRALAISNAMDNDTSLNNIKMTADSLVSVGGVKCKFKFY